MTRDELGTKYLEQLPYAPYPVQEEALLSWFTSEQGVLVCAPTGTGKTMIAQAALFEALHTKTVAYYTTPLIALTEQKFVEMQAAAVRWGFSADDVGMITGNRKVNPNARVLIVVAEILLNRLLHPEGFGFEQVSAVVMDEFHSFADPERGIVWELSLSLLPPKVRLLLLSATVGNAVEFTLWLSREHGRTIELVEGRERKIPLTYHWTANDFLNDLLVDMAKGDDATRKTPALVFAFNRDECWSIAEQLKGLELLNASQRTALNAEVDKLDWPQGIGPKLKQMLRRGVGVHHAGLLPKYRRVVEELFEKKLLSVALCTETLAAGINLPARSVVLTSLVKGPFGKEKLIDPSTAHQIFGRAGRPQFDTEGHVYAIAHEDDVRIVKWKEKYDQIPETTKDPMLLKKKKEMLKKKPTRNAQKKYWTEADFQKLQTASPARLYSKGPLPWRLLAYLLEVSPEVDKIRHVVRKRLLDQPRIEAGLKQLDRMLMILHERGFVSLQPEPPKEEPATTNLLEPDTIVVPRPPYSATLAAPTENLAKLLVFRAVHPIYGAFLADRLGAMTHEERLQAFESVLELPRPLLKFVRVPYELPGGAYTTETLDPELVARGLIEAKAPPSEDDEPEDDEYIPWEERPPHFAEKLKLLFDAIYPDVTDVNIQAVWAAGEVLNFGGNFQAFITSKDLAKQEGLIFRHLLRLILLTEEFQQLTPANCDPVVWQTDLKRIADTLTETCRAVDPMSTEQTIKIAHAAVDLAKGEAEAKTVPAEALTEASEDAFGAGILD
ncbi:MAG: DEAD/DEAH box helicase [Fimbriiglobus sp.]